MAHHKDLTGTDLHEPKGIASASANEIYVSDGAGSGAWTPADTRTPPGTVADFMTPIAPSGWLELDASTIAATAYPALYAAITIQQSGARTSGSKIITGLSSTTHMRAGYYAAGTGIGTLAQIASVDSSTQVTLTVNSTTSGTSTVIICPWHVDGTNFILPSTKDTGRYRRSRIGDGSLEVGTFQSDQNKAHTHTGTTVSGGAHTHTFTSDAGGSHAHTGNTNTESVTHTHQSNDASSKTGSFTGPGGNGWGGTTTSATGNASVAHTHSFTTDASGSHTHTGTTDSGGSHTHTFTTASDGGTEARPSSLVLMTCVRT